MKLVQGSLFVALLSLIGCGGNVGTDDGSGKNPGNGDQPDSGVTPSSDTGTTTTPPVDDSGTPPDDAPPPVDHGAPSDTYPAFKVDMPQLQNNGGTVLTKPVFVAVTFPSEDAANIPAFEELNDKIGASDYWKQVTSEYGVDGATAGGHVHSTADLASADASDTGIDAYVADHAQNYAKYGWPAPTDQTVYVLYVPKSTPFQFNGGDVCSSGVGGYHTSTSTSLGEVAYAVVFQCFGGIGETTLSASHEMGEATLDPHPMDSTPGWVGVDDNHLAWEFFMSFQSESGDLCEVYRDADYKPTSDTFTETVQRQWSNKSALAGHNPCVPVPTGAYFNTVPLDLEDFTVTLNFGGGSQKVKTKGYHVAVGETKSFSVGFNSDGPLDAWTIKAIEGSAFSPAKTSHLTMSIDKTTGQNGEKAVVTVTVKTASTTSKSELMTIVSTKGTQQHFMPILIGSM